MRDSGTLDPSNYTYNRRHRFFSPVHACAHFAQRRFDRLRSASLSGISSCWAHPVQRTNPCQRRGRLPRAPVPETSVPPVTRVTPVTRLTRVTPVTPVTPAMNVTGMIVSILIETVTSPSARMTQTQTRDVTERRTVMIVMCVGRSEWAEV